MGVHLLGVQLHGDSVTMEPTQKQWGTHKSQISPVAYEKSWVAWGVDLHEGSVKGGTVTREFS